MLSKTRIREILLSSFLGLALLWGPTASADPIDTIADTVLGQPNFNSNSCNCGGGAVSNSNMKFPYGVAEDALGNVYVADHGQNRTQDGQGHNARHHQEAAAIDGEHLEGGQLFTDGHRAQTRGE